VGKRVVIVLVGATALIGAVALTAAWTRAHSQRRAEVFELAQKIRFPPSSTERRIQGVLDEEASAALRKLRGMDPQADEILVGMLETKDTPLRRYYTYLWGRLPNSLKALLPMPRPPIVALINRQTAVAAIGKIGRVPPLTERALVRACGDPDPWVRANAALILGYKGSRSEDVVRTLGLTLKDGKVAGIAGWGYEHFDYDFRPKSVPEIIRGLDRPLPAARYEAVVGLRGAGLDALPAVPALIRTLNDPDLDIRVTAIRALGYIGPAASNALPALQKLLSADRPVAEAAECAIRQIRAAAEQ
jgi:HEAT repeat protein